jgi:hypothetical protein
MPVVITISGITDHGSHELLGSDTRGWRTSCGINVNFTMYGSNLVHSVKAGEPTCPKCKAEALVIADQNATPALA